MGANGSKTILAFCIAMLAGLAFSDCSSYYEPVGSGCCPGLVHDAASGRCTQPSGVCTIMPEIEVVKPLPPPAGGTPTTPSTLVGNLEAGSSQIFGGGEGLFKAGWFSDWKVAGLVGIVIISMIISLAVMFGKAFNLPEVLAFADTEMRQAVVSALLIFALIGLLVFLDGVSYEAVAGMGLPVQCTQGEPCYITVASEYLKSIESVAKEGAYNQLEIAVDQMAAASLGEQIQFNTYWVLFSGTSTRLNAGLSMRAERASSLFETTSSVISSIKAQEFFVEMASKTIAPAFLLIGIILRTFFFTRKLGGLLLAIAISLFFVYPLCYAFSWYTLNIAVYGDRAFSTQDPTCPAECMAHFPVAFYINPQGEIVQFDTTQGLMLAGITSGNWNTGDANPDEPGIEYPGLVACRSLAGAGIDDTVADPSCLECPDYCREIPFPSNIPSCDPEKCKSESCNPGCKVMRQRTDCHLACDSGPCPENCRTLTPVEDKCFFADEILGSTDVSPADFTVSCEGCVGCPYWCRFIKDEGGGAYSQIFGSNAACDKSSCKPQEISSSGTCPLKCQYITTIGKSTLCDNECKLNGVTCPQFCRIAGITDPLFNPLSGPYDDYDVSNVLSICRESGILEACEKCPDTCKISVSVLPNPPTPDPGCAPFPTVSSASANCEDCPEYCRYQDFSFIHDFSWAWTSYDNGVQKPATCNEGSEGGRVSCQGSACLASCKATEEPKICREYAPGGETGFCRACPEEARIVLQYVDRQSGEIVQFLPDFEDDIDLACGDANCGRECKIALTMIDPVDCAASGGGGGGGVGVMGLPESQSEPSLSIRSGGVLFDAPPDCTRCPLECRVYGDGIEALLDPSHCSQCGNCQAACKAEYGGQSFACSEFVGNGPDGECTGSLPSCSTYKSKDSCNSPCYWYSYRECTGNAACAVHLSKEDCEADYAGFCAWTPKSNAYSCFGPGKSLTCKNKPTMESCNSAQGCIWAPKDAYYIPLSYRLEEPDASNCKQCPENCRIGEYIGQCGYGEDSEPVVDCSYPSCSSICRIPKMASPPAHPECLPFTEGDCEGCPLFCRRKNDKPLPYVLCPLGACLSEAEGGRCSDSCRLEDAPEKQCDTCFDCPLDCNYYPAVRTDCNELCNEDALAGPVNIGPGDFIKKLPGADGEPDAKSVGALLVAGMVLPLFCIVMVVAFIRVLSPALGGDMDIPGIGRII